MRNPTGVQMLYSELKFMQWVTNESQYTLDHFILTQSSLIITWHTFSGSVMYIDYKIHLNFEKLLRYHFALAAWSWANLPHFTSISSQ